MRSFLLTAAIAASVVATSLTVADAATPKRSHEMHKVKVRVERVVPTESYAQDFASYAQDFAQNFAPFPASGFFTNADPRLSQIESQIDQAQRSINADRRHGYMTANEAQAAREEGELIRNTALDTIVRNHGSIPDASYDALLGRVAGLNQTIQMEMSRG